MKNIFIGFLFVLGFFFVYDIGNTDIIYMNAITNCSGTQVVRTGVGKFEVRHVAQNLPGCINTTNNASNITSSSSLFPVSTGAILPVQENISSGSVLNCNGNLLTSKGNGEYTFTRTGVNLPGCIDTSNQENTVSYSGNILSTPHLIDLSNGPLFDIKSTQIADYRKKLLLDQGIKFANPVRSVRIRKNPNMKSTTEAYLMKNDAVVDSGDGIGWDKVQGANIVVTDEQENMVTADTTKKAIGYTATKYLRDPNKSDLVRIGQADPAYWSDIAHVHVSYLVNVRSHPWYTSSIVTSLGNLTPLYIISTVDNWSEVRNESGSIHGYIRSDFLIVDKAQREDDWLGVM